MPLSYENYTGDNVTTTFNIPFTYTATSEISVTVDGVAQTGLTFPSASQVQLTSAPASSTVVQVRRTTDLTSRAVDFASGSVLTEEDLDNANIQIFHSSQEAVDLTDDTIQEDIDSKWDAESKVIKNVANPTNAQDAATKDYIENTWLTPADKAQLNSLNIPNLNTVATNIADVNAVAADATDIGTVSTNIASVNTVATNIADVVTVANDLNEAISEIETAADDLNEAVSDIDTVSTNIANVNTVGGNISNVNTVAGINSNVTTVAGISGNVTTVAGISGNVTSVAGNTANINTVAGNTANINTVATNNSDISTVSSISSDVSTVAGITSNIASVVSNEANINTVAGINSNVTTVANNNANVTTTATNIANVNSVAGNSSNINAVAANETNINSVNSNSTNINTVATNISNVNSVGGSIANVNTVASNLASVNNFADVYRIESSAPTTSLDLGDLYFDTTSDTLKVYGASGWQNAGSSINGTSQRYHYDITGTPTSVTGADANGNTLTYDAGYVDVYVNGVRMSTADVTVTSGDTVTFAEALADGDEVDIVGYGTFSVASLNADNLDSGTVPDARITGAYTGITNLTMSGNLTVDTNTLYVDSANNRVGVGTASPTELMHLSSSGGFNILLERTGGSPSESIIKNSGNMLQFSNNVTGIRFDTGTTPSEAARIDSSGNVGIGLSSNIDRKLHVEVDNTYAAKFGGTAGGDFAIEIGQTGTNGSAGFNATGTGGAMKFSISGSEAMRISSAGTVMIGRTATGYSNTGAQFTASGAQNIFVADGDFPLGLNRQTDDGTILDIRKDGTTVGSIATQGSHITIGSDNTGLRFKDSVDAIQPQDITGAAGRDNAIDLGTSSARFKNLYLSGGVYLGGTGSANYLEDYEEGTANLAFSSVGSSFNYTYRKCFYTKVGNIVHINVYMQLDGAQTLSANTVSITGLPFTSVNDAAHQAPACCRVRFFNFSSGYTYLTATVGSNTTQIGLLENGDNVSLGGVVANQLSNNSGQIMFNLSYRTT